MPSVGDIVGTVPNILLGNSSSTFMGRRTFAPANGQFANVLNLSTMDPSQWGAYQHAVLAAWIYDLHFGNTPGMEAYRSTFGGFTNVGLSVVVNGVTFDLSNTSSFFSGNSNGLDAISYRGPNNSLIVVAEGTTSAQDWGLNALTSFNLHTGQISSAYAYGRALAAYAVQHGISNINITGQSLGATMATAIHVAIYDYYMDAGLPPPTGLRTLTFASPEWDTSLRSQLASLGVSQQALDAAESSVDAYRFSNDGIRFVDGQGIYGNEHIGPRVLFERQILQNGQVVDALVDSGFEVHSPNRYAEFFEHFGFDGTYAVVVDRFGRVHAFGGSAEQRPIVDITLEPNSSNTNHIYMVGWIPDGTLISFTTMSDGTTQARVLTYAEGEPVEVTITYVMKDGVSYVIRSAVGRNGEAVTEYFENGVDVTGDGGARDRVYEAISQFEFSYSELLGTIGSALGNYLGGESAVGRVVGTALLSTIALNLGQMIDAQAVEGALELGGAVRNATDGAFEDFDIELFDAFRSAAIGSVSSYLALELGNALGLEGFGAELFNTTAGSLLSHVLNNVTTLQQPLANLTVESLFGGVGPGGGWSPGLLANAIGTFLGARLGALVVAPTTQAGVLLSTLGSAAGGWAFGIGAAAGHAGAIGAFAQGLATSLAQTFGAAANFIVPGIGAFIGFVLGALIGNLFGRKKPKVPTASATTYLDFSTDEFVLGYSTSANGGNLDLVRSMGTATRDTLNQLVNVLAGGYEFDTAVGYRRVYQDFQFHTVASNVTTVFGHTGNQLWIKHESPYSQQINVSSADEGVSKAVLYSISTINLVGGDIYAKRAVQASGGSLVELVGNMQIASDFGMYNRNRAHIDAAIAEPWRSLQPADQAFYLSNSEFMARALAMADVPLTGADLTFYSSNQTQVDRILAQTSLSQFAAGWVVTLNRAVELGLDQFQHSDFYGGLQGFLMSFGLENYGAYFEDLSFTTTGYNLNLVLPTTVDEGVFSLLPQASADGRTLTIPDFIDPYGGWAGQFSQPNSVGYVTPGSNANTAQNDYINLSTSTSAVTITDYRVEWEEQWHWVNPQTGMYEALMDPIYVEVVYSGGDDIFVGGSGNDTLLGYSGWDWLSGGAGNDTINGGYDNDVLLGGAGDDTLLGDHGNDYLAGGAGHDSLSGGAGDDVLIGGAGFDYLNGGDGADILLVDQSDSAQDIIDGGAGLDALSFERWTQGVTYTLNSVTADTHGYFAAFGDIHSGIEDLIGSQHNDVFTGDAQANRLFGGAGNDKLYGMNGADTLEGGTGTDTLNGGGGTDTASYAGSRGGVYADLTAGEAFGGDAAGDAFVSIENLRGSRYSDELKGDAGANRLEGGDGDDWLVATAGADVFDGGDGVDTVDYSGATAGVAVNLGSKTETSTVNGNGTSGLAAGHVLIGMEAVLGSDFADVLGAGAGSHEFMGGKGNDSLSGGGGSDTYYFEAGDGFDTILETNADENVVSFGADIGFNSLSFSYAGGAAGFLDIYYGPGDTVRVTGNFAANSGTNTNNRLKVLDMNGASVLDLSQIHHVVGGGTAAANTINGLANYYDLIAGYAGNDVLRGSGGSWEDKGNVIIGGAGDDTIVTSVGDDQFGFERGSGRDTLTDAGGEDVIAFGPNVAAGDVIYKVVGNDLYVGIADLDDPELEANQVDDYVRVVNGAIRYENLSTGVQSYAGIEFINAGGSWIDLRKLSIDWVTSYTSGWPPIVLDLQGDGLDLIGVDQSKIVSQLDSGFLARTSWVGPTDGFLAVDRDGDGQINRSSEISFLGDKEGAKTDLEGLQAWDTNGDGKISVLDDGWSKLKLWVDVNQNGRSTSGELKTLDEAGILEINLTGTPTGSTFENSGGDTFVHNTLSFTWASGQTGSAYDVELGRKLIGGEGLSLEELRAAWGDGASDAELGRLITEYRLGQDGSTGPGRTIRRLPDSRNQFMDFDTALEVGDEDGVSGDPVVVGERADFSDHDNLFAEDLARQLERARQAPQSTEVDPSVRAALGLLTDGIARPGMFGRPFRMEEAEAGTAATGETYPSSTSPAPAAAGLRAAAPGPAYSGLERRRSQLEAFDLDAAAERLGFSEGDAADPWAAAPVTLAGGQSRSRWWAESVPAGDPVAGSPSAPLGIGTGQVSAERISLAETDPATLSAHQKLTQAMAAFGPRSGGGAAVWKRSGELAEVGDPAVDARASRWNFQPSARMSA